MSGQAGRWYFSRKEIEESSPSRSDGIDLERETYLRRSYCTFLQDLGMRLKVPQVTIASAIVFCHRFFLRQSHAKNDRRTIATACMFLAGKVEETPRPLRDVILVSYEIINKKNPATIQKIKQKEVYERQKELILLGERVVLATLGFDLNVHHPYKILAEAIKKFKVAQNSLAQVAWNFVNDGLRTSLCLQCKPQHIAAGAIFLAAKFLKVKLPSNGEKVWWQEFDVTPHQLEEVSNQTLELYDRESSVKPGATKPSSTRPMSSVDNQSGSQKTQNRSNDNGSTETRTLMSEHKVDGETKDHQHSEVESLPCYRENSGETSNGPKLGLDQHVDEDQERNSGRPETMEAEEGKKNGTTQKSGTAGTSGRNLDHREGPVSQHVDEDQERNSGRLETMEAEEGKKDGTTQKSGTTGISGRNLDHREGPVSQSPQDAIRKIDRDKVKAALEKRRKSHGDIARKMDLMDEDDLIERELEDGIELAVEDEKIKHERRQSWTNLSNRQEPEDQESGKDHEDTVTGNQSTPKGQSPVGPEARDVEGREASLFDIGEQEGLRSPIPIIRKRKAMSPDDLQSEGKRSNYSSGYLHYHQNSIEDGNRIGGQLGYIERDNKRQLQESRV